MRFEQRLSALEAAQAMRAATVDRLVLLAPRGRITAEQQAQADAAEAEGREVFVIVLTEREAAC